MKPTVLLIHGSWHSPAHLAPLRALLEARGYAVRCPALPSVGGAPHAALREDAAAVVAEFARLLARGADVLVVAHSYGGAVASEAARPELGKAARAARGLQGGVVHLLYLCAFVLPAGQSVVDACASAGPMPLAIDDGTCKPLEPARVFYSDLPRDAQARWTATLRPTTMLSVAAPVGNAGHLYHPMTYLYCTRDAAIPVALQRAMVDRAIDAGADIETITCDAGHSPFLSQPGTVLQIVDDIAGTL